MDSNVPWLITIVRFLVWLALGLLMYFLYSRHNSHLQRDIAMGAVGSDHGDLDDITEIRPRSH